LLPTDDPIIPTTSAAAVDETNCDPQQKTTDDVIDSEPGASVPELTPLQKIERYLRSCAFVRQPSANNDDDDVVPGVMKAMERLHSATSVRD